MNYYITIKTTKYDNVGNIVVNSQIILSPYPI